jgi:hypothetical protein
MQKLKHLLYSLLFIYSSLFASYEYSNNQVSSTNYSNTQETTFQGNEICRFDNGVDNKNVYVLGIGEYLDSSTSGSTSNTKCESTNNGNNLISCNYKQDTFYIVGSGQAYCEYVSSKWRFLVNKRLDVTYIGIYEDAICSDGQVSVDGVCVPPPCPNNDTVISSLNESECSGSITQPALNGSPAVTYNNLYWQTCDSTCRGTASNSFDCNPDTYPLSDNQKIHIGSVPQAVGSKTPTPTGYVMIDSFDETCSFTIYSFFECPRDNIYNQVTELCDISPNNLDGDSDCSAGYGKRQFLDFSGVGYFSPEYSDMGAEIKHCYELYSCKSDYTVSKLQEVSCSEFRKINEVTIVPHDDNASADWSVNFKPYVGNSSGSGSDGTPPNPLGSDYNFSSKTDFDVVNNYNSSNSLDSIDKSLKGQDSNGSEDGSIGADFSDGIDFINGVKDGVSAFASDVVSIKDKLSTGFVASSVNTGSAPVFTGKVFGKDTTISMCSSLSYFASAFYYVFSLLFTWYGIILYYLGFKQRG